MPQGSLPHVTCSEQCLASVKCHPGSSCCHLPAACPSEFVEPSSPSQRPREAHCTGVHAGAQRGRAAHSGTPAQGGVDTGRETGGRSAVGAAVTVSLDLDHGTEAAPRLDGEGPHGRHAQLGGTRGGVGVAWSSGKAGGEADEQSLGADNL